MSYFVKRCFLFCFLFVKLLCSLVSKWFIMLTRNFLSCISKNGKNYFFVLFCFLVCKLFFREYSMKIKDNYL
eukprot:UN21710